MAHTPQNTIHTPAPWKLDELPISDGKHWYLCAFHSRDIGEIVCEVPLGDKVATPEEIANARLITAAPETAAERDRLKEELFNEQKRWVEFYNLNKRFESERNAARTLNTELLQVLKLAQAKIAHLNRALPPIEVANDKDLDLIRTTIAKATGAA